MNNKNLITAFFFLSMLISLCSCNQEAKVKLESDEPLEEEVDAQRTKGYSESRNAYFGDLHVHSSWSFDAFIYNVRTSPDDAYKFGKGEAIEHPIAGQIKNKRPLDFMSVTDHAEYMGIMMQMLDPEHQLASLEIAKRIRSEDRTTSFNAFGEIGLGIARNNPLPALIDKEIIASTWQKQIEIANRHYVPGEFTTFPAYEWTSSPAILSDPDNTYAANLHRNVIFRGDKVSEIPFSSFDSQDPEALWNWMELQKAQGIDLMAIPHNGNMSDGLMYSKETFGGQPIDKAYAQLRTSNEPINEVSQIKGTSMTHPELSPNDEFANFEIYPYTFATGPPPISRAPGSYVRDAFKNGLELKKELGVNPFKFGFIGSSDGHNAAGPIEEDNYFGKLGNVDGSPKDRIIPADQGRVLRSKYMSAAGLAGVWAHENTRESIYEALERKEVFATSGPRIELRFFAGYNNEQIDFNDLDWLQKAYKSSVPMGGDLIKNQETPSFIVWAKKDPDGANLDRIQVIKQWLDEDGIAKETIYNVSWSDGRELNSDATLPGIINTVDIANATYDNSAGAIQLMTIWKDPDFNPEQESIYFLRVLEIPTPRWTTYDAHTLGVNIPDDLLPAIQERAWSSPIWYLVN